MLRVRLKFITSLKINFKRINDIEILQFTQLVSHGDRMLRKKKCNSDCRWKREPICNVLSLIRRKAILNRYFIYFLSYLRQKGYVSWRRDFLCEITVKGAWIGTWQTTKLIYAKEAVQHPNTRENFLCCQQYVCYHHTIKNCECLVRQQNS